MYSVKQHLGINPGLGKMIAEGLNKCKTAISKLNQQSYKFEYINEALLPENHFKSANIRPRKYSDEERKNVQKERLKKWSQQTFSCPHCQKQMKNSGKSIHLQSCITKRLDALDEVNSDKFTEDEKQLINNAFEQMVNDIRNNRFPCQKQLQKHFPGVEFW